ncbi:hypothetical protein MMC26_004656 [Xylographa opegraphella]|nr:hypothetical protein [Xylographa opegraphella]
MSGGHLSEEVAEDYKSGLEFLTTNDRYGINNLTVIAKENTEHADAIAKVLEERIRTAPPNHKLFALYLLDSIAKNIGTPYTLFLGHNLYRTFMGAYSLVDHQVRKKLDEMLKTWKNPVPGSTDKRPVFPVEITRTIETALIKARTAAVERQQQDQRVDMLRQRAAATTPTAAWLKSSTPPQNMGHYPPPTAQGYVQNPVPNGQFPTSSPYPPYSQYVPSRPIPAHYQIPPQAQDNRHSLPNVFSLLQDIEILIITTKDQFARNPYDQPLQTRLKALLDLQTVLKTQQVPPQMLQAARDQITIIQNAPIISQPPTPQVAPAVAAHPLIQAQYQSMPTVPSPVPAPVLPSATSLADLLASVVKSKQTPASAAPSPTLPVLQHLPNDSQAQTVTPSAAGATESPLIASLRAAGILPPAGSTPVNGSSAPTQPQPPYLPHIPQINTPSLHFANLVRPPLQELRNDVELNSTSLKVSRPHLIPKLYEARPNQCSTCGRRFHMTEEGRTRKARHLDWHFRTNQRLADSAKRGQSRSWYVDELEWIRSREKEEGEDESQSGGKDSKKLAAAAAVKNDPKTKFILAPSDKSLDSLPCPICQEKFNLSFSDEVQDWVWMDAEKIGSRIYHASCYSELQKDGANTPRISTPDSVLGKRKAQALNNNPSPAKIKKETAV